MPFQFHNPGQELSPEAAGEASGMMEGSAICSQQSFINHSPPPSTALTILVAARDDYC